jgi:hypothetical protein
MMQSENVDLISAALVKAQGVMKAATYNKVNPHFKNKYADLAAVIDAIRKPMAENGLGFTQTMYATDTALFLTTTLRHTSGQWISSEYPLPMGATPQQLGSALTYARRYSLSSIACIAADEDDDAEATRNGNGVGVVPSPKISEVQMQQLINLIDEVGANDAKFRAYLKVKSLADLPSARFSEAVAALESKRVSA